MAGLFSLRNYVVIKLRKLRSLVIGRVDMRSLRKHQGSTPSPATGWPVALSVWIGLSKQYNGQIYSEATRVVFYGFTAHDLAFNDLVWSISL